MPLLEGELKRNRERSNIIFHMCFEITTFFMLLDLYTGPGKKTESQLFARKGWMHMDKNDRQRN